MGRGYAWLDTGTFDTLLAAGEFRLERRQNLKVSCPEEIALRMGFTNYVEMEPWLSRLGNSSYAAYVRKVASNLAGDNQTL